jgi:hypothetical protein
MVVASDYEGIVWSENIANTLSNGIPAHGAGQFDYCTALGLMCLCYVGARFFFFLLMLIFYIVECIIVI